MVVAEEVRVLMARRPDVKQAHLSQLLGVTQSAISARLHGRTPFDADEIGLLADFFGVSPADLVAVPPAGSDVRHQGLEPRTRWYGRFNPVRHRLVTVPDSVAA
jgi:transcriptional regulator with XRE-family HTH domain